MTVLSLRHAACAGLVCGFFTWPVGGNAQGITDYQPGKGSGPISGSASGETTIGTAPTLERCTSPLGTIAVTEPQDLTARALLRFNLPSPTGLIRLLIQQSNCFQVVERGVAIQNILQERRLMQSGQLREDSQMAQGQLVTADFVLTPDVVFSENAGGLGGAAGILSMFGFVGAIAGAVASGVRFKQAQTSMIIADTRSGLQVAAASGSVEKADWGIGGVVGGVGGSGGAIGALGAYENTAEGKIVAASFLDNWNQVVRAMRNNPRPQETAMAVTLEQETERKPMTEATLERGDVLIGKIGGIQIFPDSSAKGHPIATLSRTDEVIFLGREEHGFLQVQGERITGWIEKTFIRKKP